MSYDKSALPAMFRSARESKGLTQDQVGEMIGMSGNGYSKIESGRNGVLIDLIWPLCDALGVSRLDAMNVILPMFDGLLPGQKQDLDAIQVLSPEEFVTKPEPGMSDGLNGTFIPDWMFQRQVRPVVSFSHEEMSFAILICEFLGLPMSHPWAWDTINKVMSVRRRVLVEQYLENKNDKERDTA